MRKAISFLVFSVVFFTVWEKTWAQDVHFDPLARNIIFVEGEAEITVPVNGFKLTFNFDIDKPSFGEASQESTRIINAISAQIKGLGLANVEIIKGWDILRQARISIGAKGRKISNTVTIQSINYPEGKLHGLIANIIDRSLAVDPAVALESISVFVSEDVENKKNEEAVTGALKALQSNAVRTAEALGRKLSAPKRIFVTNRQIYDSSNDYAREESQYDYKKSRALSSFVSIKKSFRVETQVVDNIRIKATVTGMYEIE
ncbi:MAG: SIMPL domain-containing protein [Candidatus Omnitrophica bacterium]|nr:SIMPL domain-containing protein [Candidatus Omnitrophota bacterium]